MNTRRRIAWMPLAAVLLSLCVLAAGALWFARRSAPPVEAGNLVGADVGGRFRLIDQDGRPVTDGDFAGRYRLIYFGFSWCPDVCPTDLQRMAQALKTFEARDPERAATVAPIFITVDPARDRPAVLKPYVAAFHPRLVGLTGDAAAIEAAKREFRVYAARRDEPGATEASYVIDHSALTYLMGPAGEPIAFWSSDQPAFRIAEDLARLVG